jgi:hypothetical protein
MLVEKAPIKNLWCIRLNSGDEVLESLSQAVKENGIKNAFIIAGTGSTMNHHFHVVVAPKLPPGDVFTKDEGKASDVININGFIMNGRVHAHITHSDKDIAYGGHLEDGVKVLTFMSITLAEVDLDLEHWDTMGSLGTIEELRKK